MPHPVRLACAALAAATLAACATRPPAPTRPATVLPPVRYAAILQPGCLLPPPALLRRSSSSRAVLALQVDASGRVTAASVRSSAGDGELDSALQDAATRCRFAPAYTVDGATRARTEVPDDYVLNVHWPAQGALMGAARCMTPDYPHAARRVEEMGEVLVRFRKSPTTGQPEAEVSKSPAWLRILQPLSLRAVTDCLAHEEVAADLPSDRWYVAAYHWRLD